VPGTSTVALGGAPAEPSDEAMRTPRQRDAARVVAGGEGKGRGGSVDRRRQRRRHCARAFAAADANGGPSEFPEASARGAIENLDGPGERA